MNTSLLGKFIVANFCLLNQLIDVSLLGGANSSVFWSHRQSNIQICLGGRYVLATKGSTSFIESRYSCAIEENDGVVFEFECNLVEWQSLIGLNIGYNKMFHLWALWVYGLFARNSSLFNVPFKYVTGAIWKNNLTTRILWHLRTRLTKYNHRAKSSCFLWAGPQNNLSDVLNMSIFRQKMSLESSLWRVNLMFQWTSLITLNKLSMSSVFS